MNFTSCTFPFADSSLYPCNAIRSNPGCNPGCNGDRNGNPLQFSSLGNPMDRGAWQGIVHGVTKSQTWLSDWAQHIYICVCGGECNHSWILGVLLWVKFEDDLWDLWLNNTSNFLVVQWLGTSTFTVWALVRSLVREVRSHVPHTVFKKKYHFY